MQTAAEVRVICKVQHLYAQSNMNIFALSAYEKVVVRVPPCAGWDAPQLNVPSVLVSSQFAQLLGVGVEVSADNVKANR